MFPFNLRNGLHNRTVKCKEDKVINFKTEVNGEILVHYDKREAHKPGQDVTKP